MSQTISKGVNEKIILRIFWMPCCHTLICWVNSRMPNYCPECGTRVFAELKSRPELTQVKDENAWIRYSS